MGLNTEGMEIMTVQERRLAPDRPLQHHTQAIFFDQLLVSENGVTWTKFRRNSDMKIMAIRQSHIIRMTFAWEKVQAA